MSAIWVGLSLFIISLSVSILIEEEIVKVIPLTFFILILVAYILGLLNYLTYFKYFFYTFTFFALLINIVNYKKTITKLIDFNIIILLVYWCLIFWVNNNRYFLRWDEFTHWGLAAKNIFFNNSFYWPSSTVIGLSYPPGGAILQYIFHSFSLLFYEDLAFLAFGFYSSSILLSFLPNSKKYSFWFNITLSLILFYIPLQLFSEFLSTSYIDGILGLTFAFNLSIGFKLKPNKWIDFIFYSASLFSLVLMKNSGYQFAIVSIGILIFTKVFMDIIKNKKIAIIHISYGALVPLIILFNQVWYQYISVIKTQSLGSPTSVSYYSLDKIWMIFTQKFPLSYQLETFNNYIHYIYKSNVPFVISFSYVTWPIIMIILLTLVIFYNKKISKKPFPVDDWIAFLGLSLGFYFYLFYLLMFYLYQFSEVEALMLDSIDRYINAYFVVMFLVFFSIIVRIVNFSRKIKWTLILLGTVLVIKTIYPNIYTYFSDARYVALYSQDIQHIYEPMIEFQKTLNTEDKIFFVAQNTNGFDYFASRYYLTPNEIYKGYSFGPKYYDGDNGSVNLSVHELEQEMMTYDYVYFLNVDSRFIDYYWYIFEDPTNIKDNQAYEIIPYNNNQNVALKLVFE